MKAVTYAAARQRKRERNVTTDHGPETHLVWDYVRIPLAPLTDAWVAALGLRAHGGIGQGNEITDVC